MRGAIRNGRRSPGGADGERIVSPGRDGWGSALTDGTGQGRGRVLILVATGQGLANLPPVFEYGRPGDVILWLESAQASSKPFAGGPGAVLRARGFDDQRPLPIPDDPEGVATVLGSWLNEHRLWPVLVGNGGSKLTGLGLAVALANRPHGIIYGDARPCRFWVKEDPASPWTSRAYDRAGPGLLEILACTGHTLLKPRNAVRFWPDVVAWPEDSYGVDAAVTAAAHDWFARDGAADRTLAPQGPTYRDAEALSPEEAVAFREAAAQFARALDRDVDADVAPVFNVAVKTARRTIDRARADRQPDGGIGTRLEIAAARRVRRWLADRPGLPVTEAWHGVEIGRPAGATSAAQLDVTLVLANGILLHLECKSYSYPIRDLQGRLFSLRAAGSNPATMIVCAPVLTGFQDRAWFRTIETFRTRVLEAGLEFIAFTLPDQASDWTDSRGRAATCPSFEAALDDLLASYRP